MPHARRARRNFDDANRSGVQLARHAGAQFRLLLFCRLAFNNDDLRARTLSRVAYHLRAFLKPRELRLIVHAARNPFGAGTSRNISSSAAMRS